jgi:ATP-binding cassette subfamily F protein uup
MPAPLLLLDGIRLTLGGKTLVDGADLVVNEGDRLCVVGRNGSGKSSLLKVAAGLIEPDGGEVTARSGVTVRYLPQEPDLSAHATTGAYVEAALAPGDEPHRATMLLDALGLTGEEPTGTLSGGEARRAALAAVLAPDPDVLILDEPTNHLDIPAIEWLEGALAGMRGALVLVSHDRRFLEKLTRATVWLDRGFCRRLDQGFAAFEGWREQVLLEEERDAQKLARKIVAEEHWLRYGVTARRKRNERRLAGLHDLRKQYRERRRATGDVVLAATEAETSGKRVIEAKGVAKSYGERAVVRPLDIEIARGDRLAIIGANGAGKTTLLKLLLGETEPDQGTVKRGTNLEIVTLDQKREDLNPTWTLKEALTRGRGDTVLVGDTPRHVVSYMKDFLFSPAQAGTPVSVLSGGERGRLMLARALSKPANLLVLDEPTNDLDIETLDLLEEMLADHPGTVILVSHDRDFVDRIATSTLLAEGDGRFVEYAGGYSDMVAQRGAGVSARAAAPREKPAREKAERDAARTAGTDKRFGNKEREALRKLPARIDQLGASAAKLRAILEDASLFTRDPSAFAKATSTLAEVEAALATAEEEWLTLEMLREEAGA